MRRLTELVSNSFIWGVGITPPAPGHERGAAVYITVTLIGSFMVAAGVFIFLLGRL